MKTTRVLRMVVVSLIIALMAVSFFASSVGAQTETSSYAVRAASCSTVPVVNIVTVMKKAVYKPTKINVKVSTTLSFCITNKTTASQTVTISKQPFLTIGPGKTAGILCNRPNTGHFGLTSNPKAALTVVCK